MSPPVHAITSHCSSAVGNRTSIGIEIIPENPEGKFSDKSIQTVKELLSLFPPKHIITTGRAKTPRYSRKYGKIKTCNTPIHGNINHQ